MHAIDRAAEQSVARGVGFATLGIAVTIVGLVPYPSLSLKVGAALSLLVWAVLRLKALRAPTRPYRRTEVWLILQPRPPLSDEAAQRLIGEALRTTLIRFSRFALVAAAVLWIGSFIAPAALQ